MNTIWHGLHRLPVLDKPAHLCSLLGVFSDHKTKYGTYVQFHLDCFLSPLRTKKKKIMMQSYLNAYNRDSV